MAITLDRHAPPSAARLSAACRGYQPAAKAPAAPGLAHVVVIGNEKGGSGKSTTAMHLIVSLLRSGYSVGSIDLDARQATLTRYFENRHDSAEQRVRDLPLPEHYAVSRSALDTLGSRQDDERARLVDLIEDLRAHHDFLVIDTPGADSFLSRVGHSFADTLVTPMNDSFVDLDLLARVDGETLEIVRPSLYSEMVWLQRQERAKRDGGAMDWVLMRNRLSTLTARNKQDVELVLEKLAKRIGFRMAPGFGERVIFRELFLSGLTLLDLKDVRTRFTLSHVAARQEIRDLVKTIDLAGKRPVLKAATG